MKNALTSAVTRPGHREASPWACWVNTIPGISGGTLLRIRGICGNSRNFCRCLYQDFSERDLQEIGRLLFTNPLTADRFASRILEARRKDPQEEIDQLEQKGIATVCYDDAAYPDRLRRIHNPPYLLYYVGTLPSNDRPSIAIIGSRMATPYGKEQARIFGKTLAANGVQVISGMARGVDGIAGRAALDAAGMSVAVLGGGPDQCYPRENQSLYDDLKIHGCVLSEYHPGIEPASHLFPARNRIIAALSDALLVIEAKEKSGTMITVDFALEQGKDVFAVPGRVCDRTSRGCNQLLRQGAGIATCPEDLLEHFFGVGQDEDLDQIRLRELREKRAGMIEKRQQAEFFEQGSRGPGYLRQLSLEDLAQGRDPVPQTEATAAPLSAPRPQGVLPGPVPTASSSTSAASSGTAPQAAVLTSRLQSAEENGRQLHRKQTIAGLSPLEKALLSCLDSSTARSLDEILPDIRNKMKRNVAFSELVGGMTRLVIKELATEVRVGFYLSAA